MGIKIEFDPDLALRDYSEFINGNRKQEECIPKNLEINKTYIFLKKGLRVFWLSDDENWSKGEMPLCKTIGDEKLSRPIASIKMIEVTHFLDKGIPHTKGMYKVIEIFKENDTKINFENLKRIK
jgi:hypothetical protein